MQSILIPTDFSHLSRNAGYYAVALARLFESTLVLYHAWKVPVTVSSPPVYSHHFPYEGRMNEEVYRIERENHSRLRFFRETILKGQKYPTCSIIQERSFVNDGILGFAHEHPIDCIVMGTRGLEHGGDVYMAGTTMGVARKSRVPLLVVPENLYFKSPKNICLLAHPNASTTTLLSQLKHWAETLNAKITVLYLSNKPTSALSKQAFEKTRGDLMMHADGFEVTIELASHNDISVALAEYIKVCEVDMLALSLQNQSLFNELFQRDANRMFHLHLELPLLMLN